MGGGEAKLLHTVLRLSVTIVANLERESTVDLLVVVIVVGVPLVAQSRS